MNVADAAYALTGNIAASHWLAPAGPWDGTVALVFCMSDEHVCPVWPCTADGPLARCTFPPDSLPSPWAAGPISHSWPQAALFALAVGAQVIHVARSGVGAPGMEVLQWGLVRHVMFSAPAIGQLPPPMQWAHAHIQAACTTPPEGYDGRVVRPAVFALYAGPPLSTERPQHNRWRGRLHGAPMADTEILMIVAEGETVWAHLSSDDARVRFDQVLAEGTLTAPAGVTHE